MRLGDDGLLQLIAGGNQHALRTLYDRYSRRVFSLALHITGDRRRAEAVTEDVFVLVWQHHSIGQSWTGAVQHVVAHVPERLVVHPDRGTFEGQAELRDTLRQALATLPADQRQALELVYYGGRTAAELASDEDVLVSTIETRLRLALLTLHTARGQELGTNQRERGARDDRASTNDA
jgi:RNA polymerase sigma-70 factor, ECF subfamily